MPAHRALRRRFAHSHSGSQFLPHLPSHWYSDILPPHCGQTRLRIDERMRTFNSPGGASMVIMFEVSPRSGEGRNGGRMTEVCRAGFVRFVTLRTGWLRSPFMRLVLPPRSAWGKQSRCHRQSPTKAANEAGCEQARFLSGGHMGKQWACVPKFGRSLAHQELRRRRRPP